MKDESKFGIRFAVMPIEVLQNEELTPSEKILYCYLNVFKSGMCCQSNESLAKMTGIAERTIRDGLKKLSDMGWIFIEFVNNNSAMRRIYTLADNPKKLEYLIKKGLLSKKMDASTPEQPVSAEHTVQGALFEDDNAHAPAPAPTTAPEPSQAMFPTKTNNVPSPAPEAPTRPSTQATRNLYEPRPKRADYASDEEYEKAFYKWNQL